MLACIVCMVVFFLAIILSAVFYILETHSDFSIDFSPALGVCLVIAFLFGAVGGALLITYLLGGENCENYVIETREDVKDLLALKEDIIYHFERGENVTAACYDYITDRKFLRRKIDKAKRKHESKWVGGLYSDWYNDIYGLDEVLDWKPPIEKGE